MARIWFLFPEAATPASDPGMQPSYAHIDSWIFDLDNSLYPASCDLFALIDERMGAYIQRLVGCDAIEARRVQKGHFHEHGTTLAGLMAGQGVDPHEFLDELGRRGGVALDWSDSKVNGAALERPAV